MNNIKHLGTTDVAKIIRKDLKQNFKGIKFSVRSSTYSGGSSIDVSWTDGPTKEQVKELIGKYESSGFDGMTDYQYSKRHYLLPDGTIKLWSVESHYGYDEEQTPLPEGAEEVYLGTGFLFTNRETSDKYVLSAALAAHNDYEELQKLPMPTMETINESFIFMGHYYNWRQVAYQILNDIDLRGVYSIEADPDFESGSYYEGFKGVTEEEHIKESEKLLDKFSKDTEKGIDYYESQISKGFN